MSIPYSQLLCYEAQLRKILITKTVIRNPTSVTSQYRIKSYRLLIHAEIEYFLENIILEKLNKEKNKWTKGKIISNSIAHLIAFNRSELPGVSSLLSEITSKNDIHFRIGKVLSTFEADVKKNNGIKEINIVPLLVSIGVDYTKVSQTLLNNLSSFGKDRGEIAHNSAKVHQLINPKDEVSMVDQIIRELKDIDSLVTSA